MLCSNSLSLPACHKVVACDAAADTPHLSADAGATSPDMPADFHFLTGDTTTDAESAGGRDKEPTRTPSRIITGLMSALLVITIGFACVAWLEPDLHPEMYCTAANAKGCADMHAAYWATTHQQLQPNQFTLAAKRVKWWVMDHWQYHVLRKGPADIDPAYIPAFPEMPQPIDVDSLLGGDASAVQEVTAPVPDSIADIQQAYPPAEDSLLHDADVAPLSAEIEVAPSEIKVEPAEDIAALPRTFWVPQKSVDTCPVWLPVWNIATAFPDCWTGYSEQQRAAEQQKKKQMEDAVMPGGGCVAPMLHDTQTCLGPWSAHHAHTHAEQKTGKPEGTLEAAAGVRSLCDCDTSHAIQLCLHSYSQPFSGYGVCMLCAAQPASISPAIQ